MIENYVVEKEKQLFTISLIYSVFVYLVLALGIGAAVYFSTRGSSAAKTVSSFLEETGDGMYDSTGSESYEETGDATYEETGEETYDDTEAEYYDETGSEFYDETEGEYYDESGDGTYDDTEAEYYDESTGGDYDAGEFDFSGTDSYSGSKSLTESVVTMVVIVVYLTLIVFLILFGHIIAVGHLMGNGVRVTEKQFPELWAVYKQAAAALDVKKLPAFYLVESGGFLNAFATRLFTRNYVALYTDLAECLYEGDSDSVSFVIAHELIHVKRNHIIKGLVILPAALIPFLRNGWKRSCEYTCDAGAALFSPKGAERGLSLLAAGKKLASRMDIAAYVESFEDEKSVWKRFAELFASHPHLPKRIQAIRERRHS